MFAPTKTWRKWHVKVNQNQRRFATVSSLASTALPSLVLARGPRIEEIEEVPRDASTSPVSSVSSADSTPPRTPHTAEMLPPAHKHVRKVAASKPHLVLSDTPLSQICAITVAAS